MADQLYDSLICFAYWEAIPDKETVEEFKKTVDQTFFGRKYRHFPNGFREKIRNCLILSLLWQSLLSIIRSIDMSVQGSGIMRGKYI